TSSFPARSLLTSRSANRRASSPFGSQQQAPEVLRHDLPKSRLMDHDISAGLSSLSMRFHRLGQSLHRQPRQLPYPSSPTAFQARHDAQEAFRQLAFAGA